MAKRLGPLSFRRALLAALAVVLAMVVAYLLLLRDATVEPRLVSSTPAATIGSDEDAVAVAADGRVLEWLPPPEEGALPMLPLTTVPEGHRLRGPALEQVRVLGATPPELFPYVAGSRYGEGGVVVVLDPGIELRFGDASQAARKWRAAAAVLANPSVTTADYVNVEVPSHPAVGGSGHELPPIP